MALASNVRWLSTLLGFIHTDCRRQRYVSMACFMATFSEGWGSFCASWAKLLCKFGGASMRFAACRVVDSMGGGGVREVVVRAEMRARIVARATYSGTQPATVLLVNLLE